MRYVVEFTPTARGDYQYLRTYEQRIVLEGARRYLELDADVESKKRKRLGKNELAPWELKLGRLRVFYRFEAQGLVKVVAVGFKIHNELYIRGRKVDL